MGFDRLKWHPDSLGIHLKFPFRKTKELLWEARNNIELALYAYASREKKKGLRALQNKN
jgi:hypothetical protein